MKDWLEKLWAIVLERLLVVAVISIVLYGSGLGEFAFESYLNFVMVLAMCAGFGYLLGPLLWHLIGDPVGRLAVYLIKTGRTRE